MHFHNPQPQLLWMTSSAFSSFGHFNFYLGRDALTYKIQEIATRCWIHRLNLLLSLLRLLFTTTCWPSDHDDHVLSLDSSIIYISLFQKRLLFDILQYSKQCLQGQLPNTGHHVAMRSPALPVTPLPHNSRPFNRSIINCIVFSLGIRSELFKYTKLKTVQL